MSDFNPLEGRVLLASAGVYKQADLFEYNGQIFAKHGTGYIALMGSKQTSKNKVYWRDIELDQLTEIYIGKLVLSHGPVAYKTAAE
jgi:hypothetical protein